MSTFVGLLRIQTIGLQTTNFVYVTIKIKIYGTKLL